MNESNKPRKKYQKTNYIISKKRHVLPMGRKFLIIERSKNGEKSAHIASSMGLPPSTVRGIVRSAETIEKCCQSPHSTRYRPRIMEDMEETLIDWIQELAQRNVSTSRAAIQSKATAIFLGLQHESAEFKEVKFNASNGWFHKFKKRAEIRNIKVPGEPVNVESKRMNCIGFTSNQFTRQSVEPIGDNNAFSTPAILNEELVTASTIKQEAVIDDDNNNNNNDNDSECKHDRLGNHEQSIDDTIENKHEKFGAFVATTMLSMQDADLEKLCEIKIRMILAEICKEAAARQLNKFETLQQATTTAQSFCTEDSAFIYPEIVQKIPEVTLKQEVDMLNMV